MKTVVKDLENLIRIPSVSSLSNRPIAEYAVRVLQEAHWGTRLMTHVDAAGLEKSIRSPLLTEKTRRILKLIWSLCAIPTQFHMQQIGRERLTHSLWTTCCMAAAHVM
jgi:hypothetical protein